MRQLICICVSLDFLDPVASHTIKADLNENTTVMVEAHAKLAILFPNDFKVNKFTVIVDVVDLILWRKLIKSIAVHNTNKPI
jgi:hypothetical protein